MDRPPDREDAPPGPAPRDHADPGEPSIVTILRIEHGLLRAMMAAMDGWLVAGTAAEALRERAALLAVALEVHAQKEERQLFAPLRARFEEARHLVDMMIVVHDEVRSLYEDVAAGGDPRATLWTILQLTEEHFVREDDEVFPLAERLLGLGSTPERPA